MPANVIIKDISALNGRKIAKGIEARWAPGQQWVAIVCDHGTVACGAFDVKLLDEHEQCVCVAHGSKDHHLITCEDLLAAEISALTTLAKEKGVQKAMTGREAVDLLSK